MIDFIKARLIDRDKIYNQLMAQKNNHDLEGWYSHTKDKTEFPVRSKRENLFINITEKSAYIENSLHKYFNQINMKENHNYNDFSYCDILDTLNLLEQDLQYPLKDTSVLRLEFGFNIDLGVCPTRFIESNLLMEDMKSPCYAPKNDVGKKIKKFTYTEYEIKAYNKSLQYQSIVNNKNLLRVEVKYKSKKHLQKLGINSLEDLKSLDNLAKLLGDFLVKLDKLIIIDSYDGNTIMTKKDQQKLVLFTNPNYWINIRQNYSRGTVLNRKKEMLELIDKYKLDDWKLDLISLIKEKFIVLTSLDCNKITLAKVA